MRTLPGMSGGIVPVLLGMGLGLAVLGSPVCAQDEDQAAILLIANKRDDTVTFVDTATRQAVGQATTGRGPHELVATPDGTTAFVANYEGPGDSLSVIDLAAREERRKIPLGRYRAPHGLQLNRDGTTLYVTCERSRAVIELDVASEQITRAFETGQEVSHMLVLTPDGRKLYTANIGSGSATAIDLERGEVVAQIPTGAGCEGIDVTPDGREVWVSNRDAGTVSVIDTATDQVVATLDCPGIPIRVKITPDGRQALVARMRDDRVSVFDVASRREIRQIATGPGPIGILIEPDGTRAYVAFSQANQVGVLDLMTLEFVDTIAAGQEPDGLALASTRSNEQ